MDKNKIRQKCKLTFIICLFNIILTSAQDTTAYSNRILGRWVIYENYYEDSIIYVPYNSDLTKNLDNNIKYGGLTFVKDNVCLHHRWSKCGNDSGPDYDKGTWTLQKLHNKYLLSISTENQQTKSYFIYKLTPDKLIFVTSR